MTIESKLTKLHELRCAEDAIRLRYQEQIDAACAPLQAQIDALMADIQPKIDALQLEKAALIEPIAQAREDEIAETKNEADQLEQEVRADVIAHGATVKVPGLQCVYVKPSWRWNTERLLGLAEELPAILKCGKLGEPNTQIRKA